MDKFEKILVTMIVILIIIGTIIVFYSVNAEPFLPGVEGVSNVTWGSPEDYPEGYYEDGYPVEEGK